ncbi:phosphoglycerate mutase [Nostocoides sp. F2B08]|uniref:histidine phosphatase family protein n=1 Tax=Nostocoides sp. F2B08 TaxID=2653936 RepID=UPI0012639483|nr:histidine phosphatase family protein [Tetrasphaera sp. F2B08]KAB7742956.1 phosphoglycerate mutase [Tetrasphaera sp. F2B08]
MTTCLLIRHGQSEANVDGILAGHLDSRLTDAGTTQVRRLAETLSAVPVRLVVTSPLQRCAVTAREIVAAQPGRPHAQPDERIVEVRYGAWTGRPLKELASEELWSAIQSTPSSVTFPADPVHASESMTAMTDRAWEAWQEWDHTIGETYGAQAVWALVSHGDVIKALLARAMGLALDAFQSIVVDPASVSVVHRMGDRTAVGAMNVREDVIQRLAEAASSSGQPAANAGTVGGGNG